MRACPVEPVVLKTITLKNRLFVVSGPSGCGKTTLCQSLLREPLGLVRSISATTRAPRPGERRGKDYFYINKQEFRSGIHNKMFLEYALVCGHYYGTPKQFIKKSLTAGKDVLLNIDVQGAAQIKRSMPESVLIFILPPSIAELKRRLRGRLTDTPAQIKQRLAIAKTEMQAVSQYDYYLINDSLKNAVKNLKSIIIASRHKILQEE